MDELGPPQTQRNLHSPSTRHALGAPCVLSSIFLAEESLLCVPIAVFFPDVSLVFRRPCPREQSTGSAGGGKYRGRAESAPFYAVLVPLLGQELVALPVLSPATFVLWDIPVEFGDLCQA